MNLALLLTLLLLSALLLTHDLVPLGRWNNLKAADDRPLATRVGFTLLNSLVGLIPTYLAWRALGSTGLTPARRTILIVLAILVCGEFTSWWLPWLFGTRLSPQRREHLTAMSAGTLTWVPKRHGVQPNALHCVIHLLTLLALVEALLSVRA